jgi:hypothetical protein
MSICGFLFGLAGKDHLPNQLPDHVCVGLLIVAEFMFLLKSSPRFNYETRSRTIKNKLETPVDQTWIELKQVFLTYSLYASRPLHGIGSGWLDGISCYNN